MSGLHITLQKFQPEVEKHHCCLGSGSRAKHWCLQTEEKVIGINKIKEGKIKQKRADSES